MTVIPFRERVQRDAFPVTYEILSPKSVDTEKYVEGVRSLPCLDDLAAINITNNPSARVRCDPAAFSRVLRDEIDGLSVDIIPHVTCRDDTIAGLQRWLFGAWVLGIRNVLCMTGDHPKEGDYPAENRVDSLNSVELVAGIKRYLSEGHLIPDVGSAGATRYANRFDPPQSTKKIQPVDFFAGSPVIPWRNNEVKYAQAKREAGADFFQGQIGWEAEPVLDWLQEAEGAGVVGPDVPVLFGTAPLKTVRTTQFMDRNIPFVRVPKPIQKRLEDAKDYGWESVEVVSEMIAALKDGVKDRGLKTKVGLHVLPINSDELGTEIVRRAKRL